MLAISKSLGDGIRTDRSVREIVALCAKHGVPYAEPESLSEFVRSLQLNKHFAMDFWSLVARLTRDSSNPDWLLAVTVEGVTGQTVAEVSATDPAAKLLVDKVARMLAGEDVSTPERFSPQAIRESDPPPPSAQPSRLTLAPEPSVASAAPLGADAAATSSHPPPEQAREPQIMIPLASYADRDREGVAPARLLARAMLALLAIGGFWLGYRHHSSDRQSLSAVVRPGLTAADSMLHRAYTHLFHPNVAPVNRSPAIPPTGPALTALPQPAATSPNSPPLAQSQPAPSQPTASEPSSSAAAESKPAQSPPPRGESASNESAHSQSAQGTAAQPLANPPAVEKHRKTVDPVVLEAARESQQN